MKKPLKKYNCPKYHGKHIFWHTVVLRIGEKARKVCAVCWSDKKITFSEENPTKKHKRHFMFDGGANICYCKKAKNHQK